MKFTPRNGMVSVKLNTVKKTESGIYVPDNAVTDRVIKAEVVSVSQTRIEGTKTYANPVVEPGQIVAFMKGNGIPVKDDVDGDLIVLRPEEIIGVFSE